MFVATGRAINPVSKTNWEQVGVEPDVAVPADQALQTAHRLALEALIGRETDDFQRQMLQKALDGLQQASEKTELR
jgi:hypothetical protein